MTHQSVESPQIHPEDVPEDGDTRDISIAITLYLVVHTYKS